MNNEEVLRQLMITQQELITASQLHRAEMEAQNRRIEELIGMINSGQTKIDDQKAQINELSSQVLSTGSNVPSLTGKSGSSIKMTIKPPKPEFYRGKRDALEINGWLDQIKRYGDYFGLNADGELVEFAIFYLGGAARDWWTNQSAEFRRDHKHWDKFVMELKVSFYPLDHERTIMDKLEKLTQTGSVGSYVERFERLRTQVNGISDELWKRYFIKGLQTSIQIEAIKFNLDNPTASLAQLYQRVTTLGDALWANRDLTPSRTDPMDLSAVSMRKTNGKSYAGYSGGQEVRSTANVKCFKCGKLGHFRRDCQWTGRNKFNGKKSSSEIGKEKFVNVISSDKTSSSEQDFE
jgi:polyhydroxyalkanoate synthesis regulator phasin